jgi:hypothetical protein
LPRGLSGANAQFGINCRNGIELVADAINAAGGPSLRHVDQRYASIIPHIRSPVFARAFHGTPTAPGFQAVAQLPRA